jgi:hypothetical protein
MDIYRVSLGPQVGPVSQTAKALSTVNGDEVIKEMETTTGTGDGHEGNTHT